MNITKLNKVLFIIVAIIIFILMLILDLKKDNIKKLEYDNKIKSVDVIKLSPPNLKVYHSINKYAPENDVPYFVAFGVVREETGYKNPLDYTYIHYQTSPTGAEGPAQFIMSTAKDVANDNSLERSKVRYDVEFNIKLSMKYLNQLNSRYRNWKVSLGYYNTGYPIINSYALNIVS